PALISVLFSLNHGLFSWTPAVLPAMGGLWMLRRREAPAAWAMLVVVVLSVYVNAAVSDWWGGEAFGARRFVSLTVFFALGMAALFSAGRWTHRPRVVRLAAFVLVTYNLLFVVQY